MKTIAFSVSEKRPGCVILQAAFGATLQGYEFEKLFPSETWLVAPTADMRLYDVMDTHLEKLSHMAKLAVGL